ncbi:ATP-dependent helicase/nuclease subunit A [Erysipelotrichaceae bacterium]|nr:ATP-dependent helicase/nuclease subunit A [Erysipelotrichaceae bacterium]
MSKVKFTENQLAAITTRNHEVLVSAAAGAGKTAVLVERIISIILDDQIAINEVVVLTFTNAAAKQMRERLRKRLQEQALLVPELYDYISTQILLLPAANISTFHAYCIQILRNFYEFMPLSPAFKIAEENEMNLLKEAILTDVLEVFFEQNSSAFIALADSFVGGIQIDELRAIILTIYEKSRAFSNPQKWRELAQNWMEDPEKIKELEHKYLLFLQEEIGSQIENILACERLLDGYPKNKEVLQTVLEQLEKITYKQTIADIYQLQSIMVLPNWPAIKKADKTDKTEQGHKIFNDVKDTLKKLTASMYTQEMIGNQQKLNEPIVKMLMVCVHAFETAFTKEKQRRDCADFSDLEHYMIIMLTDHPDVCAEIANGITEILVDEYQDTNGVQDTILKLLKNDANRIFMVGDIKQSIYRFRLADPTIFMDKQDFFVQSIQSGQEVIMLNKNFRSSNMVLESINAICSEIFLLDILYTAENQLYFGNEGYLEEEDIPTSWHFFEKTKKAEFKEIGTTEIDQKAIHIVATLQNQLQKGEIYDLKMQKMRAIIPSDIAILFRNKTSKLVQIVEKKLEEVGIPYTTAADKGYFDAVEVNNMLALLSVLINPQQSINLLAYMRSQLGSFTDEQIYQIRYEIGSEATSIFNQSLIWYEQFGKSEMICTKIRVMREQLLDFEQKSKVLKLSKFIHYLYEKTAYYAMVAALPDGLIRQANLDVLAELAKSREQSGTNSLYGFSKYLEKLQEYKRDFAIGKQNITSKNSIEMMTIHRSKGLEFPIVYLIDLDKKFNIQDGNAPFQMAELDGLALRYTDIKQKTRVKTWQYDLIARKHAEGDIAEQLRILYVGLTRPMQQIQLFLDEPTDENSSAWSANQVKKLRSFGDALRQAYSCSNHAIKSKWVHEFIDLKTCVDFESITEFILPSASLETFETRDISENIIALNKRYRYEQLQHFEQKQTVTEIKRKADADRADQESYFIDATPKLLSEIARPNFSREDVIPKISAAKRGTLIHLVLQHHKWNSCNSIKQTVIEILQKNIISEQEAKVLPILKITQTVERIKREYLDKGYTIIGLELPFSYGYDARNLYNYDGFDQNQKLLIQGKIDMLIRKDTAFIIIDFKTDAIKNPDIEAFLEKKYEKQLELYCEAIRSYYMVENVKAKIYAISH